MAITAREQQMLELKEAGLSNAEIAGELGIRTDSVKRTLQLLDWSLTGDLAREAAIRHGSERLGRAVIAAEGHR